jgi:hypothetical protein
MVLARFVDECLKERVFLTLAGHRRMALRLQSSATTKQSRYLDADTYES